MSRTSAQTRKRLPTNPPDARNDSLGQAAAALERGEIVALPTETVYGLAAIADDDSAVEALYRIKQRRRDKPISVLVPSLGVARTVASSWPPLAERFGAAFWPGPLTIVVRSGPGISSLVTAGAETVGVRVPDHPLALDLLRRVGVPLATPSANLSGAPPATCADEVLEVFGDTPEVAAVLDGGPSTHGEASTVVEVTDSGYRVLRAGALADVALAEVAADSEPSTRSDA